MFQHDSYSKQFKISLWSRLYRYYFALLRRTLVHFFQYSAISKVARITASKYLLVAFILCWIAACKKPYEPLVITAPNDYLVVDGYINTSPNGVTTINLSRARNLGDTTFDVLHENNGQVAIESSTGNSYPLQQSAEGEYKSNALNLSSSNTYRLNVGTADGKQYQSEWVAPKQSPPIDSITWQQNDNVIIYANTHDASNNTRYYRWDFDETWQYNSQFETFLGVKNGLIFFRDTADMIYNCYSNARSTSIVLGTSTALTEDVISKAPITTILQHDIRIGIRYSILVRQYALTPEAYQYWQIVQKNTEKTGTLFDLQPSQLRGNILPLSDESEPVIGFVSAGSVQQKRIFIQHTEVNNWVIVRPGQVPCDLIGISQDPTDYRIFKYPDPRYVPYYFVTGGIVLTRIPCLDCTVAGGSNKKPSFW